MTSSSVERSMTAVGSAAFLVGARTSISSSSALSSSTGDASLKVLPVHSSRHGSNATSRACALVGEIASEATTKARCVSVGPTTSSRLYAGP